MILFGDLIRHLGHGLLIVQILQNLAKVPRFDTVLMFLSKDNQTSEDIMAECWFSSRYRHILKMVLLCMYLKCEAQ